MRQKAPIKLLIIMITSLLFVSFSTTGSLAYTKKVELPTKIVAYSYSNGYYKKVGTVTLRYNDFKRVKSITDYYGDTKRILYKKSKDGKIRTITGDQKIGFNSKEYVNKLFLGYDTEFTSTTVESGSNNLIESIEGYTRDDNYDFYLSANYKFRSNGTVYKTIINGNYEGEDSSAESTTEAIYDKNGFITSIYDFWDGSLSEKEAYSEFIYSRDKNGRVKQIVIKDENSKGNMVTVGKYVLKYNRKVTTTNKGTLRSILNTLTVGNGTKTVIFVNAFRRDKPLSTDISYSFNRRYIIESYDGA